MASAGVLTGANDNEKLLDLCSKTHKEQAVWFLNAFWEDFAEKEAENIWNFVDQAQNIDNAKAAGTALDEMEAHRFLEKADSAHTVLEMRNLLRKTGAIGQSERPKSVPLSHYFLFKYDAHSNKLFHDLVTRSQGDNQKQIEEAQAKLDAVQTAFDEASRTATAAAASLKAAQEKEAVAKSREADAKSAETSAHASAEAAKTREVEAKQSADNLAVKEQELKAAQAEVEAALAEVKKQEDAYNTKTETLKKKSEEGGVVSRNKAKNELAQHLAEDPLPLRTAKITAEAALRKAEKATNEAATARARAEADAKQASEARAQADADAAAASAARVEAEKSRAQAEAARAEAEKDKAAADDAVDAAQAAVAEAEAFLEEMKAQPGSSQGALWWMDRELHEKKKYMPMRKGGIAK